MARAQDFARERQGMVERQVAARGVRDERVLDALRAVPREAFVPEHLREFAYDDAPLPIGSDQTISQPFIVAFMAELAAVRPGDKVLEIGAGSGYAAAVLGRLGAVVFAVERHAALAQAARERLARLGFDKVWIVEGDGTRGLPGEAPFDAILVSAGGPHVPDSLRAQLAEGGRLVMPVGEGGRQTLVLVRRTGRDTFEEEDHGAVAFVPLIGEEGWADEDEGRRGRQSVDAEPGLLARLFRGREGKGRDKALPALIREAAEPFGDLDALARLADRYAERRVVLLGEATHGTAEFYEARARITERLVGEHGFTIVAVEADWPDAASYDCYVRDRPPPIVPERPFARFPRWMWRNAEVEGFLERLRALNAPLPPERQAGFYGLDIYSLGESIDAVVKYLDKVDPETATIARERYSCLSPWRASPASYGRMAASPRFESCEEDVARMLKDLLSGRLDRFGRDDASFFEAEQNARVVAGAEEYYRAIYWGAAESWNLRDRHMFETLQRLLEHRGPGAKAVVWAHNSHIGDAAATEMGRVRGEHNIGQLCRQAFGREAALLGFSTDRGTVAAASDWDGAMEVKRVRPGRADSYEGQCREAGLPAFLLDLDRPGELHAALSRPMLERAIGVIYRPESERMSHYFEAELPAQFDAWVWFDETKAVTPTYAREGEGPEETFPFGV